MIGRKVGVLDGKEHGFEVESRGDGVRLRRDAM